MERRGIAETAGATVVSTGLAVAGMLAFVGDVNWPLVVGLAVGVALATAANYRARRGHADNVAETAPPDAAAAARQEAAGTDPGEATADGDVGHEETDSRSNLTSPSADLDASEDQRYP